MSSQVKREITLHDGRLNFKVQNLDTQGRKFTLPVTVVLCRSHDVEHHHHHHHHQRRAAEDSAAEKVNLNLQKKKKIASEKTPNNASVRCLSVVLEPTTSLGEMHD